MKEFNKDILEFFMTGEVTFSGLSHFRWWMPPLVFMEILILSPLLLTIISISVAIAIVGIIGICLFGLMTDFNDILYRQVEKARK